MFNNELIQAPFKAIQNTYIDLNELKLLKYYLHFKLVLTMLNKNVQKPFLELLDDVNNPKLQKFYADNGYVNGFTSLLTDLITQIKIILDPTIYLNYIDEFNNKYYFYDE
ncbi:UNVERIFIED_CONTAM: hypothetical protein O8I53_11555 [Campylobacter lari]